MKKGKGRCGRLARGLAIALLALLAAACGSRSRPPPQASRPEVILHTEAHDRQVGEEAAAEVAGEMGLVSEPDIASYVSRIGKRVARYAPHGSFEYTFGIVDQDAPNAFALPGGFIYVSRGLLMLANSEDELANVLAHEVVHVAHRHSAARQSMIRTLPGLVQWLPTAQLAIAGYGRDQEREADQIGQQLAAEAGYDPAGLATFLKDLEYTERLRLGTSRLPSFLDSHPTTSERVAAASARSNTIPYQASPPIAADQADYLARLDGLVVGMAASEGVFQGDRFLHADLDFTMRFPEGWETMNSRAAVGAISPMRDGLVYLEHQGMGDDPELAAARWLAEPEQSTLRVESARPVVIGSFPAYRAEGRASSQTGPIGLTITWIARDGSIFRITGATQGSGSRKFQGTFLNVMRSFRPLPAREREGIRETRLRIAQAREGETLRALGERTGNQWNVQRTAVMNDLFTSAQLQAGQRVKIAVSEPYEPKRAGP